MWWLLMKYNFDPKSSIIALTVTLIGIKNEKKKIEMAFDTGATYNLIPWDVAESLGYEPAFSKKKVNITTASGIEKSPLINRLVAKHLLHKNHALHLPVPHPQFSRTSGDNSTTHMILP